MKKKTLVESQMERKITAWLKLPIAERQIRRAVWLQQKSLDLSFRAAYRIPPPTPALTLAAEVEEYAPWKFRKVS